MKRRKFLSQLKKALKHDLSAEELKENIEYYDQYIRDEVKKGYTEEEVVSSLGDPWIIAKTVRTQVDLEENEAETEETESVNNASGRRMSRVKVVMYLLLALVITIVIIALMLKLFAFALRLLLPIIIVIFIIGLFKKR